MTFAAPHTMLITCPPLHSLLPCARNTHHGPRGGGTTKDTKKKGKPKLSMVRGERLFGRTTDGPPSTSRPCLPSERPDPRTDEEREALLTWVRRRRPSPLTRSHTSSFLQADACVERNSHYGPKHPLYKPPSPGATTDTDTTARANGDSENPPVSTVSALREVVNIRSLTPVSCVHTGQQREP